MHPSLRPSGPRRAARTWTILSLQALEDRSVPASLLATTFDGASGTTVPPAPAEGTVGPNHFVQVGDGNVTVYTRAGTVVSTFPKTDVQFWQDAGLGGVTSAGVRTARILYDPVSSRWFAVGITLSSQGNLVLVARTDNTNAAGQWRGATYQAVSPTAFGDAPTLGMDANGVYIGTVNYDQKGGTEVSSSITSIPKADLTQFAPSTTRKATVTLTDQAMGEVLQGVMNLNPAAAHGSVVATPKSGLGRVNVTSVSGAGGGGAIFIGPSQVSVANTSLPGLARQPDGTRQIDPGTDRLASTVYQVGNLIVMVHTITVDAAGAAAVVGPGTTDGIRVTVLSDNPLQVVAEGTYFDNAFDLIAPSVAMNTQGDLLIGFTRSAANAGSGGTDGNLGAYAVQGFLDPKLAAPVISFGTPVQVRAGQAPDWHLGGGATQTWADHSATAPDPTNPTAFWTTQEYAVTGGTTGGWGTAVAQVYVSPRVTGLTSIPSAGTLGVGNLATIRVKFNDVVDVNTTGGTPTLALDSGGTATYAGGSGTDTLAFTYTVGAGEYSSDLDVVPAAVLTLNGGTIRDHASGLDVEPGVPVGATTPGSLANSSNLNVDATPRVTTVGSTTPDAVYGPGIVIPIEVTFSSAVDVNTAGGTPSLALSTGAGAVYSGGSGTATLTFTYTVGSGEASPDLDYASATALSLNGATIRDHARPVVNADLTLPAPGGPGSLAGNKDIVIDPAAPSVVGVTSTAADGPHPFGAVIPIQVTFTKAVNVTGTPTLALNSGGTATYTGGSGTTSLTFTYTVGAGDFAPDLDYASAAPFALNGGTIKEPGNNRDALLSVPLPGSVGSLGANKDISVDARTAVLINVTSPAADGPRKFGDVIPIAVTFDKTVDVGTAGGTPTLALNSGGTAAYTGGSGTATLTFTYTVGAGDFAADLDYASPNPFALNGGTITDHVNGASVALSPAAPGAVGSLGFNKNISVDAVPARATTVTSTVANGRYGAGSVIPIQVTFTKAVNVTGIPLLALNSGGTATYTGGTGTATLTFTYTVGAGDFAPDLDYASTAPLDLNGGTITDHDSGAAVGLTLPAPGAAGSLGANKNISVDAVPPTVLEFRVLYGSKSYNLIGSVRYDLPWRVTGIQVVFSEPVGAATAQSLTGLAATRVRGVGTNVLTWTIPALSLGSFTAGLATTGAAAVKDRSGNPVVAFSQSFRVLYGDVNDDRQVNAADEALIRQATSGPFNLRPPTNPFADLSGDGIVNLIDVGIVRTRKGTSIP